MRTLFIINTVGLYIHCASVVLRFDGRDSSNPLVQGVAPKSIHLEAYTDFVPFSIFALLACIALWQGIGWPRLLLGLTVAPPVALGTLVYAGWWIGVT